MILGGFRQSCLLFSQQKVIRRYPICQMILLMQQGNFSSRLNSRGLFKFMSKPLQIVPRNSSTPSPWVDFQGKGELQDIVVAMLRWRGAMAPPYPTWNGYPCGCWSSTVLLLSPPIDSWMIWMDVEWTWLSYLATCQFSLFLEFLDLLVAFPYEDLGNKRLPPCRRKLERRLFTGDLLCPSLSPSIGE